MKTRNSDLIFVAASLACILAADGFLASPQPRSKIGFPSVLFSATDEEQKTESKAPAVVHEKLEAGEVDPNAEGLPWWWELVWKLDIMQKGEQGEPIKFGDSANVLRTNIEQIYGGYPSLDGCPLAGTYSRRFFC